VADMEWVPGFDSGEHMLAALHPPYSLVIWDTRKKTKLWKKSYTETLVSFNFDPFTPSKLACKFISCLFPVVQNLVCLNFIICYGLVKEREQYIMKSCIIK